MAKMQHQYWITKQTLSRKFGKREDECIISSDAQLDSKLELFRNIQMSCSLIQRILDKYQEAICYLSQETNAMGRFLKENGEEDKTRAGEVMLAVGKSLTFCANEQLILHEPLIRFYQELETFRQRAIGDTLHNVIIMEKARTEYRAALSWMKNVSRELDPDTTKQLEKFKKVQDEVRRGKMTFDKLTLDCLQKVDLLAAARCNMFNHALSFYQNRFISYTEKSAKRYSAVSKKIEQQYTESDKLHIKALRTYKVSNKNNNNKKKSGDEKLLDSSENVGSLIDNITENNENSSTNSPDEIATNNSLNSNELKDLNCTNNAELLSYDWDTSKLLSQSSSQKQSDELQKILLSKHNNMYSKNLANETNYAEMSKVNWSTDDSESFLPSALLQQSLKNLTSAPKTEHKKNSTDKSHAEQLPKNQNTKSWLNLFEDLDPLSNPMEKSSKYENSFV